MSIFDAIEDSYLKVVKKMSSDINKKDDDGNTPLMYSVIHGKFEIFKYLVSHGANINERNKDRYTALMLAAKRGELLMVKYLIKNGANVYYEDKHGNTCLRLASHIDIVKYLIKKCGDVIDINDINKYGMTALTSALIHRRFKIAKYLVSLGANVENSLIYSSKYTITKYLVEHGANVNYRDKKGNTPLIKASLNNNFDTIKYLIENGANINERNKNRKDAIVFATINGNLEIIKYLIEKGAYVNGKDLLRFATINGNLDIIKYLIQNGEDVNNYTYKYENSLLENAISRGRFEIVKYFIESGVRPINYYLKIAINKKYFEIIEYLVDKCSDINCNDINLKDVFDVKIIKYLIKRGLDINKEDIMYNAIQRNSIELVVYLMNKGFNNYNNQYSPLSQAFTSGKMNISNYLSKIYILRNIKLKNDFYYEIKAFNTFRYCGTNEFWLYYYKKELLCAHSVILLNKVENSIDIHEDLMKYILRF